MNLSDLAGSRFDVAVIGGGINGCAIAEEAAARGLSVLDVTGTDVAAFCDRQLVGATPYLDKWRSSLNRGVAEKLLD